MTPGPDEFEDQLRQGLRDAADQIEPDPEALDEIRRRLRLSRNVRVTVPFASHPVIHAPLRTFRLAFLLAFVTGLLAGSALTATILALVIR